MINFVNEFGKRGIYTLLEFHQDLFGKELGAVVYLAGLFLLKWVMITLNLSSMYRFSGMKKVEYLIII